LFGMWKRSVGSMWPLSYARRWSFLTSGVPARQRWYGRNLRGLVPSIECGSYSTAYEWGV